MSFFQFMLLFLVGFVLFSDLSKNLNLLYKFVAYIKELFRSRFLGK